MLQPPGTGRGGAITLNIRRNSYGLKDKLKAGLGRTTEATE